MKPRYRIEILDKETKQRTVYLTDNFRQDIRFHMVPVNLNGQTELVNTGYENVNINIPYPVLKKIAPLKKKKKVVRKRKKRRIRKH